MQGGASQSYIVQHELPNALPVASLRVEVRPEASDLRYLLGSVPWLSHCRFCMPDEEQAKVPSVQQHQESGP